MNGRSAASPSWDSTRAPEASVAKPRELTVSSIYVGGDPNDGRVPYIRMSGRWLERLGFTRGARILVVAESGKLSITISPSAPKRPPKRRPKKTRKEKPLPHLALVAVLRRRTFERRMAERDRVFG